MKYRAVVSDASGKQVELLVDQKQKEDLLNGIDRCSLMQLGSLELWFPKGVVMNVQFYPLFDAVREDVQQETDSSHSE